MITANEARQRMDIIKRERTQAILKRAEEKVTTAIQNLCSGVTIYYSTDSHTVEDMEAAAMQFKLHGYAAEVVKRADTLALIISWDEAPTVIGVAATE